MTKNKKLESMQESNVPGASKVVDFNANDPSQEFSLNIDQKLVDSLEAEISKEKERVKASKKTNIILQILFWTTVVTVRCTIPLIVRS